MAEPQIPGQHDAVVITTPGGPEVLRLATLPVPAPAPGEVLIKVAAAGVNRHDCHQRRAGPEYEIHNPVMAGSRSARPAMEVCGGRGNPPSLLNRQWRRVWPGLSALTALRFVRCGASFCKLTPFANKS